MLDGSCNFKFITYFMLQIFYTALRYGNNEKVLNAIQNGANPDARDSYGIALFKGKLITIIQVETLFLFNLKIAIRFNYTDIAITLINSGANLNNVNNEGKSPLMFGKLFKKS
jgi:ankyrin repeat protein